MKTLISLLCLPFVLMFGALLFTAPYQAYIGVTGLFSIILIPIYIFRKPLKNILREM